jgi:hypothetical protein
VITTPKPATLARYGLSLADWQRMLGEQGGVCACCRRQPPSGRLVVDHLHAKGWHRMPPERRRLYVRGACCSFCNRNVLRRGVTLERAQRTVAYLAAFETRRP